ncbi:hypothetical protein V6Z12_A02G155600 [Gossypium hirsutum]
MLKFSCYEGIKYHIQYVRTCPFKPSKPKSTLDLQKSGIENYKRIFSYLVQRRTEIQHVRERFLGFPNTEHCLILKLRRHKRNLKRTFGYLVKWKIETQHARARFLEFSNIKHCLYFEKFSNRGDYKNRIKTDLRYTYLICLK